MVASDTVVGLVGAGVLLVALVGVFVYESNVSAGGSEALTSSMISANLNGKVVNYQGAGLKVPPPAPNAGACASPAPGACPPPASEVDLTILGLPDPRSASYVGFFVGGQTPKVIGKLTPSGDGMVLRMARATGTANNNSAHNAVVISLETSASPSTPGWELIRITGLNPRLAAGVTISMSNVTVPLAPALADGTTVSFTPSGGGTNVSASFPNATAKAGFTYRGWMVTLENATATPVFTFVGNWTASDGSLSGVVTGGKGSYSKFIVTADIAAKWDPLGPSGPTVFKAAYNMPAGST